MRRRWRRWSWPGSAGFADRHPRDLSGGERQRLALAIVLGGGGGAPPAVLCLDEPTRGMDRAHKADLAVLLGRLAASGTALLVATHDPEFAAAIADRVVLLGDGAADRRRPGERGAGRRLVLRDGDGADPRRGRRRARPRRRRRARARAPRPLEPTSDGGPAR